MPPPIFRPPPCRVRELREPDRRQHDLVAPPARTRPPQLRQLRPQGHPRSIQESTRWQAKITKRAAPPSLRDIAEQAYDDLETRAPRPPRARAPNPRPLPKNPLHPTTDRAINRAAGYPSPEHPAGRSNRASRSSPEETNSRPDATRLIQPLRPKRREAIRSRSTGARKTRRLSPSFRRRGNPFF